MCSELPTTLCNLQGKITVINGKVYSAGWTGGSGSDYTFCCYDQSQDKWTTLPSLPVRHFGLGQICGKLVAVGGAGMCGNVHNEVHTYDERSQKWKQTIPPMPTARLHPSVLSFQSALLVIGGTLNIRHSNVVEIFKLDTLQWYLTGRLPVGGCLISIVAIGNTCYALGGYNGSSLNQALYASIDDLLDTALPANQTTSCRAGSIGIQSAWKTLPNTRTYGPTAVVLAGSLLAIGGKETSGGGASKKEVYMYSPSTNSWVYINDLPAPLSDSAATALSSTEILVIGGYHSFHFMNTVYKGTLQLKQ